MSETQPRFQCRHIHSSGARCASPSLRKELFCYFHHGSRKPIPQSEIDRRRGHQSTFKMPALEDRTGIQLAIHEVLQLLASNDLDPKRAGLLLYGLQIASSNLPRQTPKQIESQSDPIEEVLFDETHGPIAPETEFQTAPGRKTLEQILREQWAKDDEQEAAEKAAREAKNAALDQAEEDGPIDIQAVAEEPRSTPNPNPMKILPQFRWGLLKPNPSLSIFIHTDPRSYSQPPAQPKKSAKPAYSSAA
jgi:hypothetical protein